MNQSDFNPRSIAIYSVGLLGASLGLGLKAAGYRGTIFGISSPRGLEAADSLGCIDEGYGYDRLEEVVRKVELLVICSPIHGITDCLRRLGAAKLPDGLVISDVGSTKAEIARHAKECLPAGVRFIGGHPMAGSEKSGPLAADPYLFQNAIYVLTPPGGAPAAIDSAFAHFLERHLGCRHTFLDPETHDTIAATVSHTPHILAVALVNVAREMDQANPGALQLAAGGFRDLTRIASSPYAMWHDILTTNKQTIEPILRRCIEEMSAMREELLRDKLRERFESAARTRGAMPIHNKGFITPLYEALVQAKDEPGVIASISTRLADHGINIKDIEVVKIREGEGGTIRLGFGSLEIARRAVAVLREHGFPARERT
jgi:prephenate dehydrogenase